MNIDITVFKKILLKQIQKHTTRIIHEDGEMAQQWRALFGLQEDPAST